jgi:hypothetical protein
MVIGLSLSFLVVVECANCSSSSSLWLGKRTLLFLAKQCMSWCAEIIARHFFSENDRRIYLEWLREAAKQFGCTVHAFALMPNHVHVLLTPQNEDSLAKTMQSLGRRYAQYFN